MSNSCGIILAGGQSRRMGRDKALLSYGDTTFLVHTASILLPLVAEIIVVAETPDRYVLPFGRVVGDRFPGAGPVGGILTGLTQAGEGWHYVVACDMPGLQRPVLELLRNAAADDIDAVVPEIDGHWEPLCAVYRHTAAPPLLKFMESGGRSAQGALKTLNVRRVDEEILRRLDPDNKTFVNINTPEDLETFAGHRPK
jgi:molybdenum cofactor guanylyltransferase